MFHYFIRGAVGDLSLLKEHEDSIKKILQDEYSQKNIEKLRGHDVYSLRLGAAQRLLFTTLLVKDKLYLLLLDYLPTHDYDKSRFLRSGVLSAYKEKVAEQERGAVQAGSSSYHFDSLAPGEIKKKFKDLRFHDLKAAEALDYYHNKVICLDSQQNEALGILPPALITGAAGSGKSCVALSLLSAYVHRMKESPVERKRILYLTKSVDLLLTMQKDWLNLPAAAAPEVLVEFKTYEDFIREALGQTGPLFKDRESFFQWYRAYLNKEKSKQKVASTSAVGAIDEALLYEEFRICAGYTEDEYLKLGKNQSMIEAQRRAEVLNLLGAYRAYNGSAAIDLSIYELKSEAYAVYDLMLVDEAQDLSHVEIKNLAQCASNKNIIFLMDSHQRLYDRRSILPYIEQLLRMPQSSRIQLESTYRCPPAVIRAANEVIKFKHILTQGLSDKWECTQLDSCLENTLCLGSVHAVTEATLLESPWLRERLKSRRLAVVTSAANRARAAERFATPLIFTPETIKGLEYDVLVAWQLYDPVFFKQAKNRFDEVKERGQPKGRAKAGCGEDIFAPELNKIYTSYTRSKAYLIICEEKTQHNAPLLDELIKNSFSTLPELTSDELLSSTAAEWAEEVNKQLRAGNAALARRIYSAKIGTDAQFNEVLQQFSRPKEEPKVLKKEGLLEVVPLRSESKKEPFLSGASPAEKTLAVSSSSAPASKQPKQRLAQAAPKTVSANQKRVSSSSLFQALAPSPEEKFSQNLFNDFTEQRLLTVLKLDQLNTINFLKGAYLKERPEDKAYSLLDYIFKSDERFLSLLRCFVNNGRLFSKFHQVFSDIPFQRSNLLSHKDHALFLHLSRIQSESIAYSHVSPACFIAASRFAVELSLLKRFGADLNQAGLLDATPAHFAAEFGNIEVLQALKELGANLNSMMCDGSTPAVIAAKKGNIEVLEVLNVLGADLNAVMHDGSTPAVVAAHHRQLKVLPVLKALGVDLNAEMNDGSTLAYFAAERGYSEVLQVLGSLGADLNRAMRDGSTPVCVAAQYGHTAVLQVLKVFGVDLNRALNNGATPALLAAQNGHTGVLRILKEEGADLNRALSNGATPALLAAQNGHIEVLRLLKEGGADLNRALSNGATPALLAAQKGYTEILRILKAGGADLNRGLSNGTTPASLAAQNGHIEVLRVLKAGGADFNAAMCDGVTPAFLAAEHGHAQALFILKDGGADLNKTINNGLTPAASAAQNGHIEVLRVLKKLGVDLKKPGADGRTLAYYAVLNKKIEVLRFLKDLGIDFNTAMNNGATPAALAAKLGYTELLDILEAFNGNQSQKFNM